MKNLSLIRRYVLTLVNDNDDTDMFPLHLPLHTEEVSFVLTTAMVYAL